MEKEHEMRFQCLKLAFENWRIEDEGSLLAIANRLYEFVVNGTVPKKVETGEADEE